MTDETPEFYATAPISKPVVVPEIEDTQMNGFAWSAEFGLVVSFGDSGGPTVDELRKLRIPTESLKERNQGNRGDI